MFEALDKVLYAGLGALAMTREKAEKMFDEYVEKGKAERENKESFVQEMMDGAEKAQEEFQKIVGDQIQDSMKKFVFATKEDIQRIEAKIDQLLDKKKG